MHEWALADAVLTAAVEAAQEKKFTSVDEIVLNVGELQTIDTETFKFVVENLLTTAPESFKSAKVRVIRGEARLSCNACQKSFTLKETQANAEETEAIHFIPEMAHVYMKCPACGSPDFTIVEGRGVFIQEITGQV